jgi:hypothetical protein
MIIIGCFTTLLFSNTLFSGLTSITSNSEGLGKVSDISGNTMIIPQAAAQRLETQKEVTDELSKELAKTGEEVQLDQTCSVNIELERISYNPPIGKTGHIGDNIGKEWTFYFGIFKDGVRGDIRTISTNTLNPGHDIVFTEDGKPIVSTFGAKSFPIKFPPFITEHVDIGEFTKPFHFIYGAREIDRGFDDIGDGVLLQSLQCIPQQIPIQIPTIAVLIVTERGDGGAKGDIEFHFLVTLTSR